MGIRDMSKAKTTSPLCGVPKWLTDSLGIEDRRLVQSVTLTFTNERFACANVEMCGVAGADAECSERIVQFYPLEYTQGPDTEDET